MKKITVREIMKLGPCDRYNIFTIFKLIKFGKTPLEILGLPISKSDKFWLLLRPDYIPIKQLHILACDFAQEVAYLNSDPRVQAAIDAKRLWIDGKITDEELKKARDAAYAAYAAARAADAASAAASAARANIETKQIEMVKQIFIDMEEIK